MHAVHSFGWRFSLSLSLSIEIALVVAIVVLAGVLRSYGLTAVPPGLNGDEAIAGLEGRRILSEGWIGPYSPLALGQPSAPLYLTAVSLLLFGETVFAVRFVPALLGALTVVALYAVLRRHVDASSALAAAGMLAVLSWHLHYSRIGFPIAAWPLVVVLAVGAVLEAVRRSAPGWWAVSGVLTGAGLYVYNAHPLVIAAIGGFVLSWLVTSGTLGAIAAGARGPRTNLLAFAGALGLVVLPILRFALDARNGYFQHHQTYSFFNQPEWITASAMDRAGLLIGRYLHFWDRVCCRAQLDGADAAGLTPLVPLVFLALSAAGLALALWRHRGSWAVLGALIILVMPLGAVITVEGLARRTFAMAPVLAAFAGYGIIALWRIAARRRGIFRIAVTAALALLTGLAVYQSLDNEFRVLAQSPEASWVFARDMADASRFMAGLPPDQHVYFLSDRWSVNYETRRFLAPDVSAEDRSAEFGAFDLEVDRALGAPVFVLLGVYESRLPELQRRYPGGETVFGRSATDPTFVAYVVPPLSPTIWSG